MVNVFDTTRVPGFRSRIFGRSFMLIDGSRNIVMTVAFERSVSKRSALTKFALSDTPADAALRFDNSTISGLYSMPIARVPRLAAVMTVRPSPEPRSIRKSCGVTLAMSSILSTRTCGVGTHTTSLPGWPTSGWNGFVCVCCACAATPRIDTNRNNTNQVADRRAVIMPSGFEIGICDGED